MFIKIEAYMQEKELRSTNTSLRNEEVPLVKEKKREQEQIDKLPRRQGTAKEREEQIRRATEP